MALRSTSSAIRARRRGTQIHELGQPSSFGGFSEEVMSRLAPETLELLAYAPLTTRKAIASQAVVRLSHGPRL